MGMWKIEIHGTGIHHNKRPDDANELAKLFVDDLKAKGHTIHSAKFEMENPYDPSNIDLNKP